MLLNCLCVGCGGFLGAILRYLCSFIRLDGYVFPFVTLGINILGSFAIMFFASLAARAVPNTFFANEQLLLFLRVGLCGGFTTFSTFSAETVSLLEQGKPALACMYALLSLVLCVCAAFAGELAARALSATA